MNVIAWEQTADRRTWRAAAGVLVLTVTKVSSGMFRADVEGTRSQEFRTRLAAQGWAEQHAGVTR